MQDPFLALGYSRIQRHGPLVWAQNPAIAMPSVLHRHKYHRYIHAYMPYIYILAPYAHTCI